MDVRSEQQRNVSITKRLHLETFKCLSFRNKSSL